MEKLPVAMPPKKTGGKAIGSFQELPKRET